MPRPYTQLTDKLMLGQVFDEMAWEIGDHLRVEREETDVVGLTSGTEQTGDHVISGDPSSPYISTQGMNGSGHNDGGALIYGVWEIADDETALLWELSKPSHRSWPWNAYRPVVPTVASDLGLERDKVRSLLLRTAVGLSDHIVAVSSIKTFSDRHPLDHNDCWGATDRRKPAATERSNSREGYYREGYEWSVHTVERASLRQFLRANFRPSEALDGEMSATIDCITAGLTAMAQQLETEADIVETLHPDPTPEQFDQSAPFFKIAYPEATHCRETNAAIRTTMTFDEACLDPVTIDLDQIMQGLDTSEAIAAAEEDDSDDPELVNVPDGNNKLPSNDAVRTALRRLARAGPDELPTQYTTPPKQVKPFVKTRVGLSETFRRDPQDLPIAICVRDTLRVADDLSPLPAGDDADRPDQLTPPTSESPQLRHWLSVTDLDRPGTLTNPYVFVAIPYVDSLATALDVLEPHTDTPRNICRGCGEFYDVDPTDATWFCDRCGPSDAGIDDTTTPTPFDAEPSDYCYICLSQVAKSHLDCHHCIPRDFFETEAVRDDPRNIVTVHAVSCPGHNDALSHQTLDHDIKRAVDQSGVESRPARAFNIAHMTRTLATLASEMQPASRKRTINTIHRMRTTLR